MKRPVKNHAVTIRYMGSDTKRTFIIERGDKKFWTGKSWTRNIDRAKVFPDHKSAQKACNCYLFCSFAQESRSEIVRLNTGLPGCESFGSARK